MKVRNKRFSVEDLQASLWKHPELNFPPEFLLASKAVLAAQPPQFWSHQEAAAAWGCITCLAKSDFLLLGLFFVLFCL